MADQMHNIGLGRMVQWYLNVDENNPANSALVVIVWNTSATDGTIKDLATVAALKADPNTAEVTNAGYARKVLTDADLVATAPDNANDRWDLDIPDQTWTGVAAGDNWTDLNVNYDDDTAGGTDSDIEPGSWHDFVITPNGGDITAQIDAAGFFRAQ